MCWMAIRGGLGMGEPVVGCMTSEVLGMVCFALKRFRLLTKSALRTTVRPCTINFS